MTKETACSLYLKEILFLIKNFNDFDVTGHFDFIIRKACYDDRALLYNDHKDLFDEIFTELISRGKGFEINTASFRDRNDNLPVPTYDIEILKRYHELGGEIITIGSDAHSPEYKGCKFGIFKEILKAAGFKYVAHFEKRKPVFEAI
jgi:histidinol-phosphatase (PHP family)